MLRVDDVTAGYGSAPDILRGVSFEVQAGEAACIIGPNGAGKSTLLSVLAGLLRPRRGRIYLDGQDVTGRSAPALLRAGVVLVPQGHSLFGSMTVEENLLMGGFVLDDGRLVRQRLQEVYRLFPILQERRKARARTLSGGMQKMVEIGRALMLKPRVVLLDEPSLGLAPKVMETVFGLVSRLREWGLAVLIVEQNARKGLSVSDRGLVLDLGQVVHEGPAQRLLEDPRIQEWYLGKDPRRAAQPATADGADVSGGWLGGLAGVQP